MHHITRDNNLFHNSLPLWWLWYRWFSSLLHYKLFIKPNIVTWTKQDHNALQCHVSCVMCHVSCVMCHVSCVMCHVSCVLCLVTCVVCHVSWVMLTNTFMGIATHRLNPHVARFSENLTVNVQDIFLNKCWKCTFLCQYNIWT